MQITFDGYEMQIVRQPGDPRLNTDSRLLYQVKLALIREGLDVIKKRMWKDGHLVDDQQQYLRSRRAPYWCLADATYALRSLTGRYNNGQPAYLFIDVDGQEDDPLGPPAPIRAQLRTLFPKESDR